MNLSKTNLLTGLLLASLLGNLLLIGMAGGKYFASEHSAKRPENALTKIVKDLPAETREKLEAENAAAQTELAQKRKELKQQREQINNLLHRPNVNREKLEAAYAKYRATSSRIQELQHSMTINTMLALSPAEREQATDKNKKKQDTTKKSGNKNTKQPKKQPKEG